ncbi:MAG TPA: TIGR03435 family protein [Bryobacteraceae bacterium]|nr:TIGR03435 family protein [Bryobacteraceae bacterium]
MLPFLVCVLALQADSFEVAAIKPTPPDWRDGRFIRMQTARQLVARNHAVRTLIAAAYNLNPKAITGGPPWVDDEHFDILAEAPGDARPNLDQQMAMLRTLLADRFQLKFHRERREMPVYALTVARTGPKFKESPDIEPPPEGFPALAFVIAPPVVRLPARHATMGEIASVLQRAALNRPVVDQTGLTARYDFDLEFTPDDSLFGGMLHFEPADDAKPGLLAALQEQLGMKLEATRGPVDVFVIDQVSRPTEN